MDSSIRLGRIFGIPVGVHYSWFLVFFLVTMLLSDEFGRGYAGWAAALATSLLFFLSVLAHELSHSLVALARGIPVKGITLFIFGGVSQIAREANSPFTEFIIAIVGPLTSIALGFAFWGLHLVFHGTNEDLARMAEFLGSINILLGIFNMLPGFPLDGGRVLRACLWWVTRSYWTATRIATRAGQGIALLLIAAGVAIGILVGPIQGVWLVFIGIFLGSAALASHHQFRHREMLRHHTAAELAAGRCPSISADLTLRELADQYGDIPHSSAMLVTRAGQVTGLLTGQSLTSIPKWQWDHTSVQSAATPIDQLTVVGATDNALSVLELMEEKDVGQVLIVNDGTPLGCLGRESLLTRARERRPRTG